MIAGARALDRCCLSWKKLGQRRLQGCLGLPSNVHTVVLLVGLAALPNFFLPLSSLGLWKLTAWLHALFGDPCLLVCYQGYKGKAFHQSIAY